MNQAERWLSICFQKNINNVQAKLVGYNDKLYMFTRRTPENCDFLYYLESVEKWFNKIDIKSNIDMYQNFCDLVYPINSDLELIKYFNEKFQLNLCSAECKEIIGMGYCITCGRFVCIDRRLNINVVLDGKKVYCRECWEIKKT